MPERTQAVSALARLLLLSADDPAQAVTDARRYWEALPEGMVPRTQLRSILRAAGMFARDEEGYFVRESLGPVGMPASAGLPNSPAATHALLFPVPVEQRVRVAYGTVQGLLLKFLFQQYKAVPMEVSEGLATLAAPSDLPTPDLLWEEFLGSPIADMALGQAMRNRFVSVANVGREIVTEDSATSAYIAGLLRAAARRSQVFMWQSGGQLHYFHRPDLARDSAWVAQQAKLLGEDRELREAGIDVGEHIAKAADLAERFRHGDDRAGSQDAVDAPRDGLQLTNGWSGLPRRLTALLDAIVKGADISAFVSPGETRSLLRPLEHRTLEAYQFVGARLGDLPAGVGLLQAAKACLAAALEGGIRASAPESTPALDALRDAFVAEYLPVVSREEQTRLALARLMETHLLWLLADCVPEDGPVVYLNGWNASLLRRLRGQLSVTEQGAVFFTRKDLPGTRGAKKADLVGGPASVRAVVASEPLVARRDIPFDLVSLASEGGVEDTTPKRETSSDSACLACGRVSGTLGVAGMSVLPESKKRHYDRPQRDERGMVCSACLQVANLTQTSPALERTALVEVQVDNFLELFALYEALDGVAAMETLKALNRVSTLSVFPGRYLMLSESDRRGRIATDVQHLLQLARQRRFLEQLGPDRPLKALSGNVTREIPVEIPLLLGHFRNLPPYYSTDSDAKVRTYELAAAITAGRPYRAAYAAVATKADEPAPNARQVFTGRDGMSDYDREVRQHEGFLNFQLRGASRMPHSHLEYKDVQEFSDLLLRAIEPVAKVEQDCTGSNPPGIVRKYTDPIRRLQSGSATMFEYQISTSAERYDTHEKNPSRSIYPNRLRNRVAEVLSGMNWEERKEQDATDAGHVAAHLERVVGGLFEKYGGPHGTAWKAFLEEVEARTLALLLLTVRR